MLETAVQPQGSQTVAVRRSGSPIMNGIPPDGEVNETLRPAITASAFQALQDRLRTLRPISPSAKTPARIVIPDLPVEPVADARSPPAAAAPEVETAPAEVEEVTAPAVLEEVSAPAEVEQPVPPAEAEPVVQASEAEPMAPAPEAEQMVPEAEQVAIPAEEPESDLVSKAAPEPPELPAVSTEQGEESLDSDDLLVPLVEKFSGTSALLKKIEPETDPFSKTPSGLAKEPAVEEPIVDLIDPQSGDVARSLLDVMSAPPGTSQPQERSLAADTLLRLVPRLPLRNLLSLVERVCLMAHPPQLLVRRLMRDPRIEIAGPLLESASAISDQDLMAVIAEGDASKQRLIARRRTISPALSSALLHAGDAGALLTLVRNPGATFAIESFHRLGEVAAIMPALQAPLATRLDTPAPVAFELFWVLPAELRRYVLSRFLTDSEILNRILKIALTVGNAELADGSTPEPKFPDRSRIDEFVELVDSSDSKAAAVRLAELAGISEANADRIMADREGEPITVVLKALGLSRARFAEVIDGFRQSPQALLRSDRNIADLQSLFDSLSFNKARMLLTYWDWAAQHSGPYARSVK